MNWNVPLVEIEVADADVEAVLDCLRSGWLTMGPRTQRLEATLAERIGVKHAVAVSSGTAALHLACRAVGLGRGDEAIVPALTFVATAHAVRYLGADVVLCDSVAENDAGIDVAAVERLISPRTKAVLAVHMWGYPAAVEQLRRICDTHGLALIEDCAEAIDARTESGPFVGSIGDLGCFSFFSKKQLAVGEGGVVTTDDDDLAASVRSLRTHAMSSVTWERHRGHGLGYDVTDVGYNYRIDESRSALGLSRIERLAEDIARRRQVARSYRERLAAVDGVELPYDDDEVDRGSHFAFPVLLEGREVRDRVRLALRDSGIQSTAYPALHGLTLYEDCRGADRLANAEALAGRHVALPIFASLRDDQLELVCTELERALQGVAVSR
jgi:dTDP-4-amino-4,6-dideoxygalactose transaminase